MHLHENRIAGSLVVLSLGVACGPNVAPVPPPASSAGVAAKPPATPPKATSSSRPEEAPAPSTSAKVSPPASDATSFGCGNGRCSAGKELCCALGMSGVDVKCVSAPSGAREDDMKHACYPRCELPPPGCEPQFADLGRCDESQDCGAREICCRTVHDSTQHAVMLERCLPRGASGHAACPEGDEVCLVGGPACRASGAECVDGVCKKPVRDPAHACATAADCLVGQRCIRNGGPPQCTAIVPPLACTAVAECRELCSDERARCVAHPDKLDQSEGIPVQKRCECP